eukprot:symbB.v1.2.019843.t4/scaffold1644.1/size164340/13
MEPNFTNPVFEMRFAAAVVEDRSKAMPQRLIPCWLIYPWSSSPLWRVGPRLTLCVAVIVWLAVFWWGKVDNPIASMANFCLGIRAARVAQEADQNQVLLGRVAPLPRPSKEPLADNQVLSPPPPVNHSNFPSVGSAEHETRLCKPCVFFWNSKGCRNGQGCLFCHVCRPGEKKRRKQERRFVASMGHTEIRDTRTRSPVQGDQVLSPPPPVNHSNFPSVGSAEHETRRCDPCAFFWNSKGVKEGQNSSSEGLRCCAAPGIHRVWLHLSMNSFLRGGCPLAFEIFLKGDNCMNLDVVSVVAKFQNILPISLKALTEAVWRAEGVAGANARRMPQALSLAVTQAVERS